MSGDNMTSADNQQETLYYFTGFLTGEGSLSLIKATNRKGGTGFYYTPDLTISNSDLSLLKETNQVVANGRGIITPIKGGYNLSIRGKKKVKTILCFLNKYPPLSGDLIREKIFLLHKAISILSKKKNRNKRLKGEEEKIEKLRERFKEIKRTARANKHFSNIRSSRRKIGYFLAGIVDAEGSMGLKKSGNRQQPYFCVLMREEAIIDLFQKYFGFGQKYYRPAEKLFHFETAKRENVRRLCKFFLEKYPVKISRNQERFKKLQWFLNDYTPRSQ
jgi:hypothetical protein